VLLKEKDRVRKNMARKEKRKEKNFL